MATDLHTAANRLLKAWDLNDLIHEHIEALRQALANEALDKMAENARELGLDYEPAQPKYRRGDRLICLETEEYCVIHISGTDRQWVKFPDTHIGVYKNEQLAELFELLPKEIEIEQPAQQEPVSLEDSLKESKVCCGDYAKCHRACTPRGRWEALRLVETAQPAQRTWVGLSDLNIDELENEYMKSAQTAHEFLRAIEAKLKEKNT